MRWIMGLLDEVSDLKLLQYHTDSLVAKQSSLQQNKYQSVAGILLQAGASIKMYFLKLGETRFNEIYQIFQLPQGTITDEKKIKVKKTACWIMSTLHFHY